MSLNFWYIEARTLVKIIIEKFKERSSKGAKSDRWLSSGKESTVNHSFDSGIPRNILIKKKRKVFEK